MSTPPAATEPEVLQRVTVRLLREDERPQFDRRLETQHYLASAQLAGQTFRYVAELDGQWVALLTFSAAAFHLKLRERWSRWTPRQCARRLLFVVNHSRFLVLPERARYPNLASRGARLGPAPLERRLAGALGPSGAGRREFRG